MGETQYDRSKIFEAVKDNCGLNIEDNTFDNQLMNIIDSELSKVYQMGVGKPLEVSLDTKWDDLKDPKQTKGNASFSMVKQFIYISTRLTFDPPPPNTREILTSQMEELRIRVLLAYENGGEDDDA